MNTSLASLLGIVGVFSATFSTMPGPLPQENSTGNGIAIVIVDDHTGGLAKGVLDALTAPQLLGLLDLVGQQPIFLSYYLVQERVAEPTTVVLKAWNGGPLPTIPDPSLPSATHEKKMAEYEVKMNERRRKRREWEDETIATFTNFQRSAAHAQAALELRWQQERERRGIRDWNRSAVADTVIAAVAQLQHGSRAYMVAATDGQDLVSGRPSRKHPFSTEELPERITIIWISDNGEQPRSPLFTGLRNNSLTRADLAAAVAAIAELELGATENGDDKDVPMTTANH